jgi:hypothetical protein
MEEHDEEVAELSMTGYNDVERQFVDVSDDSDDDEGKKKGFLMRNGGWISLEVF